MPMENAAGDVTAASPCVVDGQAEVYQSSGFLQAAREKIGLEPLLDLLVESPLYNPNKPGAITGIIALALAESGQRDRT
jgi:hypothetical protein